MSTYHPPRIHAKPDKKVGGYRIVLRDNVFLSVVSSNMIYVLYSMLVGVGFAVFATSALHAPLWSVGLIGIIQTGLVVGLQTRVTSSLQDNRRTRSMLFAGGALTITCLMLAISVWVPSHLIVPYLLCTGMIFTAAQIVYIPASRALAAELSPSESRGRHVALFEFSYGVAAAIAPAFFGFTFDIAVVLPWVCMGILLLGAMFTLRQAEPAIPLERNRPSGREGVPA